MNCKEIRSSIEDFHYGELEESVAERVAAHIRSCGACAHELEVLRSEDLIYQAYADEVESSLDIAPASWEGVASRVARTESGLMKWWRGSFGHLSDGILRFLPASGVLRQAVFAAVLVALSITGTLVAVRYYNSPAPVAVNRAPGQTSLEFALQSIQRAEQDYIQAIDILSSIVDRQKSTLDPRLLAEFERNLQIIDENIAATRKAFHDQPTDPELARYMLAAYSKKVELLQELAS